jgi:hypothetical protein
MDPLTYYARQSPFTDPGRRAGLLDDMPRDVTGAAVKSYSPAVPEPLEVRLRG